MAKETHARLTCRCAAIAVALSAALGRANASHSHNTHSHRRMALPRHKAHMGPHGPITWAPNHMASLIFLGTPYLNFYSVSGPRHQLCIINSLLTRIINTIACKNGLAP